MNRFAVTGLSLAIAGAALVGAPAAMGAPAAPTDKNVTLTSQQLTDQGFPTTPNVTAWGPGGSAALPTTTAPQWQDVIISGKAPTMTQPGQLLTMSRYVPANTQGDGVLKPLNITAVVQPDRSPSPCTSSSACRAPTGIRWATARVARALSSSPSSSSSPPPAAASPRHRPPPAPRCSSRARSWPPRASPRSRTSSAGAAPPTISTSKAKAGAPVTISGTAPTELKAGTVLTLQRFVPTDKKGSGHFEPVGTTSTVVKADGTFELTFEVNQPGRYGYTLGAGLNEEWIGIEFQLKTT